MSSCLIYVICVCLVCLYLQLFVGGLKCLIYVICVCLVCLYLQLFVGGLKCLIYVICVCLCIVVSNSYCVVLLFCLFSSCVPYVASFSVFYRRPHVLFTLFVFVYSGFQQLLCFCFVFLCLVYPMFPASLCFIGGLMSYLRYLCLFVYSGVQYILCCVFVLFYFSSGIPSVASISGLPIFDCPFGIRYLI